ncbi:phosphoribosylanthranilate isomerase [Aeropyrum pernix]|uniref:phosphoribosylanthranilate isomerase n=1 Tax=Aeropyrum pernix TaxID=56636 RepID=UPI000AE6BFED|nr:hypothetical protein [Aeropyrum pernix]
MKVKICGVKKLESALQLDGLVDYIGFVHSLLGGPRSVPLEAARIMASQIEKSKTVLVVHGSSPSYAAAAADGFDVLQYHEPLLPSSAASLQATLDPLGVTLAVVVEYTGSAWKPQEPCGYINELNKEGVEPEYILLDTTKGLRDRIPLNEAAKASRCSHRVGLAGGLTPRDACKAVETGVSLIDVSRGVETGVPGVKDPLLSAELIMGAKRCSS